jgi:uncharacterized protein DUF5677
MEIDEILDKWFDETFAMYQEKVHPPKRVDLLMMGVLRYSRHCSITTFSLLRQEAKLSSMVLLRAYLELYVKLLWCLKNDPNSQEDRKDEAYARFRRWDFKRLFEQKKLFKKELEVIDGSSKPGDFKDRRLEICKAVKKVDCSIKKNKAKGLKCIPDIWQLIKEISEEKTQYPPEDILGIYPRLFQRLGKAVHPDMDFIQKMVTNSGKAYICNCDVNEDIQELKLYMLSLSCDINRKIRDFYGWDSAEVQKDYDLIIEQLTP